MNTNNPIKYSDLIAPDDSITKLIDQLETLQKSYVDALKSIGVEAKELIAALNKVSGATEEGRKKTKQAATDAEKLAAAQEKLKFAESDTAKEIARLNAAKAEANRITKLTVKLNNSEEGSYDRLSAQYSINKIKLNAMTAAERANTAAGKELEKQTNEIYEEMKKLQEATGKYSLNVGNYTNSINEAAAGFEDRLKELLGLNSEFGNSLMAMGQGGEAAQGGFAAMGQGGEAAQGGFAAMRAGASALGKTLLGLLANPVFLAIAGIAAAGAAFKFWFDYNKGLVEATRLTQQFTGKEGDALKAYRNEVQGVSDTFGADFRDTLMAANALAQQFGISADEALKLVKDGFVSGGDANGEFLSSLKEYPAYFKEAGVSADQFVAIVAQTNKMGIFSDKGVDAIKEANLRLREMTPATAAALDAIGISSQQVQTDLQTGAKTTFQVMQDVSAKLGELPDSAASVGTAIADIFGGAGEDAGLQYLRTLKDISTDLDEVKDKAGILGQLQEEQMESQIELSNAVAALFDATGGTFETMTTRAKTFVNDGLIWIIKGIIDIANYFIGLYNDSLVFRALWQGIVAAFKTNFDAIGNLFGYFGDLIQATGKMLRGAFTLDWDKFKEGAVQFATALPNMVKAQMKDTQENFKEGLDNLNKKVKPITIPVSVGGTTTPQNKPVTTQTPIVGGNGTDAAKDAEKQAKKVADAYKKNLDATRKYEDAKLKLETDSWKKQEQATKYKYARQIQDLQYQLANEKDLTAEGSKAITATIEVLEQEQTAALEQIERDRQLAMLEQQRAGIELRLAAVAQGSEQERLLRLELLENERATAHLQNASKPAGEQQATGAINAKFDTGAAEIADEYMAAQLAIFDAQQQLAQSEYDLLRNSEGNKTRFRLQAEKDRLLKILELNKAAGKKMSDLEVQMVQNTIKKIDQEIKASKSDERSGDIYGLFGLNLDDDAKEAISTSIAFAMDALNEFLAAKVAAADQAVEAADKEVEASQRRLDAELTARANGYANNVVMAQKELDMAKKNQAKAIAEQKKAQKEQAAIQTLQQIGSLVTATAMIWGQLGFPWAIPAIAVMWGSFAASKIMAANLTKQQTETYGDGTVELLSGGSHQSGNDVDLGTKADGTRRRAEGGEFFAVINKRSSRQYRKHIPDVINSLNNGTFASKYLRAYAGASGLTLNVKGESTNIDQLAADVREIREQNKRRTYIDAAGRTVVTYKNLKRKIS